MMNLNLSKNKKCTWLYDKYLIKFQFKRMINDNKI